MDSKRELNLRKMAVFTVVINALQIAAALAAVLLSVLSKGTAFSGRTEMLLLIGMAVFVCWGALLDIREATHARRVGSEADSLEEALRMLTQQQATLRAQRHDFMNHLQVVSGLLELEEYQAAGEYIEKVYGDIVKVNRSLKTAHPAINALLAAKMGDCEGRGITLSLAIGSPWEGMPVPSWEICRLLGNLIDNAMDALKETPDPRVQVSLSENLHEYALSVANNGPAIPEENRERIFQSGFSTKSAGRGMGLAIVEEIVRGHGGTLSLTSDKNSTCFSVIFPKTSVKAN